MPKMRLGWYAGVSTALAGGVVLSAFQQRANFYSAMVYLSQSNFCLLAMVNFILLLYSSLIYGLTRLCYGNLRAVEIEQLTERAWLAIIETCLAMTIFRDEIGSWFIVMFTALVTGKVWGWIGDGRVEFLEQQPPANPRLFHTRLSISLAMSFLYDIWVLRYTINSVIQQARPNMMVMFLFEFAVLTTCSWRTGARYILSLIEQKINKSQTRARLLERRQQIREERERVISQREAAIASGQEPSEDAEPLPNEDNVDEMDIEVPGWTSKGEWVLWLDLATDMIKLGIYIAFFFMLLLFYGLPIHIMRDLLMTARDFLKRLNAILRYRKAIQEMNKFADATREELAQENTCIICREEMRFWDTESTSGTVDRVRPKKLPCGHILHLGCLKSWLERQQVCPTCRNPVTSDRSRAAPNRILDVRVQNGGQALAQEQQLGANNERLGGVGNRHDNDQPRQQGQLGGPRVFNLGPLRFGFGANGQQARELGRQFGIPQLGGNQEAGTEPSSQQQQSQVTSTENLQNVSELLQQAGHIVHREVQALQVTQQELQVVELLMAELRRLHRQRRTAAEQSTQSAAQNYQQAHSPVSHNQSLLLPSHGVPQISALPLNTQAMSSRVNGPAMVRHGTTSHASAIPAGSSELPDGVVIPPGWSLLPLQRLDGLQNQIPVSQIQRRHLSSSPRRSAESPQIPVPTQTSGTSNVVDTPPAARSVEASVPSTQVPSSTPGTDPAVVAAPDPVLPNWGGQSQLFGSSTNRLERFESSTTERRAAEGRDNAHVSSPLYEEQASGESSSSANAGDDPANDKTDKTKGKAVTVEDAEGVDS